VRRCLASWLLQPLLQQACRHGRCEWQREPQHDPWRLQHLQLWLLLRIPFRLSGQRAPLQRRDLWMTISFKPLSLPLPLTSTYAPISSSSATAYLRRIRRQVLHVFTGDDRFGGTRHRQPLARPCSFSLLSSAAQTVDMGDCFYPRNHKPILCDPSSSCSYCGHADGRSRTVNLSRLDPVLTVSGSSESDLAVTALERRWRIFGVPRLVICVRLGYVRGASPPGMDTRILAG
jgi:hypothetical protein